MNRNTGGIISGWDHCEQSINVIVGTALNTRFMRLTFGSDVPNLIDRPGNASIILKWYVAIVSALSKWEPGYRVTSLDLISANPDGSFAIALNGVFYPFGHLGDYSVSEQRTAQVLYNSSA